MRDAAAARRAHLVRLQTLDAPPTPGVLREAVRAVVLAEDSPDKWPSGERASDAELYLDNLKEQSEGWWSALEHVEPEDVTFRRIATLAEVFATHLHDEVRALVRGEPEAAPLLTLMTERARWSIPAIFARVSDVHTASSGGSKVGQPTVEVPDGKDAQTAKTGSGSTVDVPVFVAKWRDRLRNAELNRTGDGRSVERTFESFRNGRYEDVLREAPAAWRWSAAQKAARDLDTLVAVYAWAHAESAVEVAAHDRLEALALVLREARRLSQRVPSLQDLVVPSLAAVLAGIPVTDREAGGLTEVVLRMAEDPPGSAARERFGALLRMADASALAQRMWDHFRGSGGSGKGENRAAAVAL